MTVVQFIRLPRVLLLTALLMGSLTFGCGGGAGGQKLRTACKYLDGFTYNEGSGKCCKGNPSNGRCIVCDAGDVNCRCECCP